MARCIWASLPDPVRALVAEASCCLQRSSEPHCCCPGAGGTRALRSASIKIPDSQRNVGARHTPPPLRSWGTAGHHCHFRWREPSEVQAPRRQPRASLARRRAGLTRIRTSSVSRLLPPATPSWVLRGSWSVPGSWRAWALSDLSHTSTRQGWENVSAPCWLFHFQNLSCLLDGCAAGGWQSPERSPGPF